MLNNGRNVQRMPENEERCSTELFIFGHLYVTALHNVKSTVKISSIFVAFLENMNFT